MRKAAIITVEISNEAKLALKEQARLSHRTLSGYVRFLIQQNIKNSPQSDLWWKADTSNRGDT